MINSIIDISHHNGKSLDFVKARADGIIGVIHKASQGQAVGDPMYASNRRNAEAAGLLWGAYHFGTASDGAAQAKHFLKCVGDAKNVLLVLDFEPNGVGNTMTLNGAHDFVSTIHNETGQFPGLYSGSLIKEVLKSNSDPLLANCWFWLAQYGPVAVVPPNWPTWTMWQYTDGAAGPGPHEVDGIGHCDRDRFQGDEEHLHKLWGV